MESYERTVYFDYLRVFATLAIMVLHIAGQKWNVVDVNSQEWAVFNFYDSIVRWGVPVFVMISGALFLNMDIPVRTVYKDYIPRLAVSFIVWSVLYAFLSVEHSGTRLENIVKGHYHLWFLLMIIGLYICIPIMKAITRDARIMRYYLVLSALVQILIPWVVQLTRDFGPAECQSVVSSVEADLSVMSLQLVRGFPFYFILGYFVNQTEIPAAGRGVICLLGIAGFLSTVMLDHAVALRTQTYCSNYYGEFSLNVCLEALSVFVWFKYHGFSKVRVKWNRCMEILGKYSFGAYLIHAFVIEILDRKVGFNALSFHPAVTIPILAISVFVISLILSAVLNHIPVVKKYLV